MFKRVKVIVNPAAGQPQPILRTINNVFQAAGIDWDIGITKSSGDGQHLAQEAVDSGFEAVAAYGGDGTVTEVASGLLGSQVPLAILPGGTANLMAVELGIPGDLTMACRLIAGEGSAIHAVDVGQSGNRYFMQGIGIGVQAEQVKNASRELKNRFGILAYIVSALQALQESTISRYRLVLDGQEAECDGLTCLIVNIGNFGLTIPSLMSNIDVSDGLLDIFVIRNVDIPTLLEIAGSMLDGSAKTGESFHYWQAHTVNVVTDPPHAVQADGEVWGETPIQVKVLPQAVHCIVSENRKRIGAIP